MSTEFLNPYDAVNSLGLKEGMSVADFGSGSGHWAMVIAKKVGDSGRVYAIDIQASVLEVLDGHIKIDALNQIQTLQSDLESEKGSTLAGDSQDLVLCANILHQAQKPEAILEEAYRITRKGGKVAVVDWTTDSTSGPKQKIGQDKVKSIAEALRLKIITEKSAGGDHYLLIFEK